MKALSDKRFAITRRMFESGIAVPGGTAGTGTAGRVTTVTAVAAERGEAR